MVSFSCRKLGAVLKPTNFKRSRILGIVKKCRNWLLATEKATKMEDLTTLDQQQQQISSIVFPPRDDSSIVNEVNFGFGFDDTVFSDRVLRLEIMPSASSTNSMAEKYLNWFSSIHDDLESETGLKVITLRICSLLLAAKSPVFYKLLKNGMRESQLSNDVTLRIHAYEEAALLDVLNCIYGKPLKATSAPELLDVLMAADKFEVTTCMEQCVQLLLKLPMSLELALFYLELASSVFVGEVTKPLIDATKQFLAAHYSVFTESKQEAAMGLPLCAVEALLASDDLQVLSEDDVFDFIFKWVRAHYPKLGKRRKILTKHLARHIRMPRLSSLKLKEAVKCPDLGSKRVSKLVLNALLSKIHSYNKFPGAIPINKTLLLSSNVVAPASCGFPGRGNKQTGVFYFDIPQQECTDLFPSSSCKQIHSEAFYIGKRCFSVYATCLEAYEDDESIEYFTLFLEMTRGSESCEIDFDFAV